MRLIAVCCLLSAVVDFGITQIVDSNVGVHSIIPKWPFNASAWETTPYYQVSTHKTWSHFCQIQSSLSTILLCWCLCKHLHNLTRKSLKALFELWNIYLLTICEFFPIRTHARGLDLLMNKQITYWCSWASAEMILSWYQVSNSAGHAWHWHLTRCSIAIGSRPYTSTHMWTARQIALEFESMAAMSLTC